MWVDRLFILEVKEVEKPNVCSGKEAELSKTLSSPQHNDDGSNSCKCSSKFFTWKPWNRWYGSKIVHLLWIIFSANCRFLRVRTPDNTTRRTRSGPKGGTISTYSLLLSCVKNSKKINFYFFVFALTAQPA